MKSNISIAGHPLHPALVALPIGLVLWAFAADIGYIATDKSPTWYNISFYSGIAAVITAVPAALTGFADYLKLARGTNVNDIALLHMGVNLFVVALFIVAAVLQADDNAMEGSALTAVLVLHASGATLLALSGWLGGEMVFRHHVATLDEESEGESASSQQASGSAQPRGA